jgi:dihydrofolate synthase/folylpolyglutamate synthase
LRYKSLDEWLSWQESLNPKEIDLGLERVTQVLQRAGHNNHFNCPLITVTGTNGKGSVVACLEAIALAAGYKTCTYTSPHLLRYNERIRINGTEIDDYSLCRAFERIDVARADINLTYFEFGTLAAIDVFMAARPDLVIMEIGLGGRLDAVNVM